MKTVETLSLRKLVLIPAAVLLWGCSGTTDAGSSRDDSSIDPSSATPMGVASMAQDRPGSQDPVGKQREQALIDTSLRQARRALELKAWPDARTAAATALSLDPTNEEARNILRAAGEMLQDPSVRPDDFITKVQVAQDRARFTAGQEMRLGDALMEQGQIGDAVEKYERAELILKYNPFATGTDPMREELARKLAMAREAQAAAAQDAEAALQAASERARDDLERRARIRRDERVQSLFESANIDFQQGRFASAVRTLDQALAIDPNHQNALALRDIADRAQHESRLELARADWKAEWSRTFDDLRQGNIPQTETLKIDPVAWAVVDQREPISFTPPADLDDPAERAIIEKLRETVVEHQFANATIQDWKTHYQSVTDVNFFIHPDVAELEAATLTDFNLPRMSVYKALDIITSQAGMKWRVNNGLVELLSGEAQVGRTYLVPYEVRDLVLGVRNKPGPTLKLKVPGEEEFFLEDDEEPTPTVVDEGRLEGLITNNIGGDTWDSVGMLRYQQGILLVRHTREVHQQIEKLLADLRQAVGIQVDIEARFLKVEDSFLEDVGVDFRGLGNQASEGVAGRGLEQNNRSNLRFDDFGRPETINSAVPGIIGTGAEPGIFYDDGGDGDLLARTENLFDNSLGRGEDGISNGGGLSIQAAFLDDVELEVVLRAVEKQQRSEEIVAPRILVYNNTRAHMSALRHTSFIRDFEVEIAQAAAVANPIVDVVRDGVVLDVRPVVSADRRFITMELRPTVMTLQLPIPTFSTTLGAGQPVNIQLPEVNLQSVRTTVTVPDGSTLMLGGMRLAERQRQVSGVPFLKDLPGLSFLFSRKGTYVLNRKLLILIRASIILTDEHVPEILPDDFGALLSQGR